MKKIDELNEKEAEMKKKYEKMISDMQDRIKALKMGSDTVQTELKETKGELLIERRHYDKFLVRDRERLVHGKEVVRNRMIVK
jgi:hypothetical protein